VTTVENTGAQAQIDVLSVNRSVASSDTLTLTIGDTSVTQTYSTSESNTLDLLTASFNAAQTGVLVTFDAPSKIMSFTAVDPGTPFPHPTLTIDGSVTSVNLVANVYAVAQVDSITLQRNLLAGDTLALTFSGQTIVQAFSGSETDTLAALKATVDAETATTLSIA
jgi:hypothetical protein